MKKILICIDCQNDFITGSLRNEEAIKTIPNLVKKFVNSMEMLFSTPLTLTIKIILKQKKAKSCLLFTV